MKIVHYTEVPAENPGAETRGVTIRWLISREDGAPNYYMRVFEISPGGYSPPHRHPWEHEVYILSGEGEVVGEEGAKPLRPGTAVFVPGDELHQFKNTGQQLLRFICTIPSSGT
ncbi:cupin domain-containing protein [Candidatus Solincola sp.]|jgi:quercetin dioxygenase-like cupin family protein|nr:cupin domain-containing protein [Actinomycetota bacterium]MDI7252347.1 cupin domain-containing protein [Actinomycetota bacterium]